MLCYAMLCYAMLWYVMQCYAWSNLVLTVCLFVWLYVCLPILFLFWNGFYKNHKLGWKGKKQQTHVVFIYFFWLIFLFYFKIQVAILCYAMLRHATLCYAMHRYVMLRFALLWYIMLRYVKPVCLSVCLSVCLFFFIYRLETPFIYISTVSQSKVSLIWI
jgi:hypothetical protein